MTEYFRAISQNPAPGQNAAPRLAGGWASIAAIEVLSRARPPRIVPFEAAPAAIQTALTAPRMALAGLSLDRPRLMGILNLTPDSFSDGGRFNRPQDACARAQALAAAGMDILDIGGESTRPGAQEIAVEAEIDRTAPVIAALRADGFAPPISIDTRKSTVARAALGAGADIVNDVSAFRFDPGLADVIAQAQVPVILMHSVATPETMQAAAQYDDVLLDVYDALEAAVAQAEAQGIPRRHIMVDPGIGFGKRDPHNLALLARVSLFHSLGTGILLGVSRKGFIGRIAGIAEPEARGPASAAVGLWAISQGVQVLRVHDIPVHRQMISLWQAASGTAPMEAGL